MHTGYELLHDNARVILRSINKIDIIGVEFHCRTWHEWKTLYSDHVLPSSGGLRGDDNIASSFRKVVSRSYLSTQ